MNFFEKELRRLFENSGIFIDPRFAGRMCLARLTETINVKLEFTPASPAIFERYDAVKASVLSRSGGLVDSAVFHFADILGRKTVPDHPNFAGFPYIRKSGGQSVWEWHAYKPSPRDFEMIADTVDSYLEMFREPAQRQEMSQRMR